MCPVNLPLKVISEEKSKLFHALMHQSAMGTNQHAVEINIGAPQALVAFEIPHVILLFCETKQFGGNNLLQVSQLMYEAKCHSHLCKQSAEPSPLLEIQVHIISKQMSLRNPRMLCHLSSAAQA